jgi:plasmid stabilization system protein ParE
MKRFILTPRARQDIDDIWDYIANDNIESADRVSGSFGRGNVQASEESGHWPLARGNNG